MKEIELRRHGAYQKGGLTPGALTHEAQLEARAVGKTMRTDFAAVWFSPAQRAAETAAWFLRGSHQPPPPVVIEVQGLTSEREDEWREAGSAASSSRLDSVMEQNPSLVAEESDRLAGVVRDLFGRIKEGEAALVVGHTPLQEAAVYGLTGVIIEPLKELEGMNLTLDDAGDFRIQELRLPGA
jgi:broad specificity phosphatase PhoE